MEKIKIILDKSNGFVAIPSTILDIEMNSGAKSVLIDLCNLANEYGKCWPSLEWLSSRLRRSKASVSNYISELRNLGLIETQRKKMQSGYDYKLEFTVTFWKEWLSILKTNTRVHAAKKTERSVQNTERPTTFKNKSKYTNTSRIKKIYEKWCDCKKGAPFNEFSKPPDRELLSSTTKILEKRLESTGKKSVYAYTLDRIKILWTELNVEISDFSIKEQAEALQKKGWSEEKVVSFLENIRLNRKPFWRNPPTLFQFELDISKFKSESDEDYLSLIANCYRQFSNRRNA
jgi:predicted transcriptional regulator